MMRLRRHVRQIACRWAAALAQVARIVARLVIPVECPGCGTPDLLWCDRCAGALMGLTRRVERAAPRLDHCDGHPPLPVWAMSRYDGPVRGLIVAWKDHGRCDLDRLLIPIARHAAHDIAHTIGFRPDYVVPAPSHRAARRQRGRNHLEPLAKAIAQSLGAQYAPMLHKPGRGDQVGQGVRGRGANAVA
ncbi:MAG: hypothetical protein LBB54_06920, partial [Cellulomonadaceae bacterium]|nr:hypothetical protein [Cellulomonadaceae bacterium]